MRNARQSPRPAARSVRAPRAPAGHRSHSAPATRAIRIAPVVFVQRTAKSLRARHPAPPSTVRVLRRIGRRVVDPDRSLTVAGFPAGVGRGQGQAVAAVRSESRRRERLVHRDLGAGRPLGVVTGVDVRATLRPSTRIDASRMPPPSHASKPAACVPANQPLPSTALHARPRSVAGGVVVGHVDLDVLDVDCRNAVARGQAPAPHRASIRTRGAPTRR